MRIIKFRGFHADEYGETVIKLDGKEIRGFWCYGDLHTDGPYINEHKVLPETVGQFLNKNDKNDNELFEGDIIRTKKYGKQIKYFNVNDYDIFVIAYDPCCYRIVNRNRQFNLYGSSEDYEKIGNIFENPDLLEVENADD